MLLALKKKREKKQKRKREEMTCTSLVATGGEGVRGWGGGVEKCATTRHGDKTRCPPQSTVLSMVEKKVKKLKPALFFAQRKGWNKKRGVLFSRI